MTYTQSEVIEECIKYFGGDELAAGVCMNKYLLKNSNDEFLEKSPDDIHKRLASEFARIEKKYKNSVSYDTIYESLKGFEKIICQGSPMAGIGNNEQVMSIGNCFVIGSPHDSYSGIMKKDEELAQIMKRRGGVGIDISSIRPMGAKVKNAARTSDGIGCFMDRFSNTTLEVAQNGRRGALILLLSCKSPDIMNFINIKRNLKKVTGANISIRWTDDFLKCVERDEEYTLRWPVDASIEDAKMTKVVRAKEVWDEFIKSNWESAEPGCLFWDTILNQSISDCYTDDGFGTVACNPCSELTMSENGGCILQVVNLLGFVDNKYTSSSKFNFEKFEKYTRLATRLMDDMIDLEIEKCDKILKKINIDKRKDPKLFEREYNLWKAIRSNYIAGRRTGLGVTGLGDTIAALGITYTSDESLKITEDIFKLFHSTSYDEGATLAQERGYFEHWNYDKEKESHYIKILPQSIKDKIRKYGRRNIGQNTCAPCGSISILAQTTSGIEPVFKRSYIRNRKMQESDRKMGLIATYKDDLDIDWMSFEVDHHGLENWINVNPGVDISKNPYINAEAGEIDIYKKVEMQSIIQKYIDHSISVTHNLNKDATEQEISDLYMYAWKNKCKGATIYRDGSRLGVLTSKVENKSDEFTESKAMSRQNTLPCEIQYSTIKGKSWIFFIGLINKKPYEIFGGTRQNIEIPKKYKMGWIKKNGKVNNRRTYDLYLGSLDSNSDDCMIIKDIASVFSPDIGSYTRTISMMLRHGVPIKFIVEQLRKDDKEANMFTFESSVARVLKKYIPDGLTTGELCQECNQNLVFSGGCSICPNCGWTKCE